MEQPNQERSRRELRTRWIVIVIAVPLLLLGGYFYFTVSTLRGLDRVKERLREKGEPASLADVAPPELPPEENASPLILQAVATARLWNPSDPKVITKPFSQLTSDDIAILSATLPSASPVIQILKQASSRKHSRRECDYSVRYQEDFKLPSFGGYIHTARYVTAHASVAMHEGRTQEAYEDNLLLFRLAYWSGEECPFLINAMLSLIHAGMGVRLLEELWSVEPPDAIQRQRILDDIKQYREVNWIHQGFRADRVFSLMPRRNNKSMPSGNSWNDRYLSPLGRPWSHYKTLKAQNSWDELILVAEKPSYVNNLNSDHSKIFPGITLLQDTFGDSLQGLTTQICIRDNVFARLDLAIIAIHLDDYREEHGHYPASLDEIPDLPKINPLNGAPYRYLPESEGYILHGFPAEILDATGTPDRKKYDPVEEPFLWKVGWHP